MKKNTKQDFQLGLTTIMTLAILVGSILFLAPRVGEPTRRIEVHFKHTDGMAPLKKGSPVTLNGALPVGKVTDIELRDQPADPVIGGASELTVVVFADVWESVTLWGDCQITTDAPPVGGGGALVILDIGTAGKKRDAKLPIIGLRPQSLQATVAQLSRRLLGPGGIVENLENAVSPSAEDSIVAKILVSLADVNAMTAELRLQLTPAEEASLLAKVHRVADDVVAATAALRTQTESGNEAAVLTKVHGILDQLLVGLREITDTVKDSRPLVNATLTNVEHATRVVNEQMIEALRAELNRDDPNSLLGKLHTNMSHLTNSLENVEVVTDTGRRVVVLNRPLIDATLANFKSTSDELKAAMVELRLSPWKILFKPTPEEIRQMGVFEAARMFAEAAAYLDDASARLEAARQASDTGDGAKVDDEDLRAIRESLRGAFDRFQSAEKYLYDKINSN
ncbi:MAG: hypothetical protein JNG88_05235 [Phycisphaerales bacterium]|nr:hypothetical protein [Phycisphaerales bacterium]